MPGLGAADIIGLGEAELCAPLLDTGLSEVGRDPESVIFYFLNELLAFNLEL